MSGKHPSNNPPTFTMDLSKPLVKPGGVFSMESLQKVIVPANKFVDRRVRSLKNIQKQYAAIEKQYKAEVRELDRKYYQSYEQLFVKRASVVNGEYEPTDEEAKLDEKEQASKEEQAAKESKAADDKEKDIDPKGVPGFWLTVMKNNAVVSETIFTNDEEALKALRDVRYTLVEGDKQGFMLHFHFAENPFFTDSVLTKVYYLVDDEIYDNLVFDKVEGCKINWKSGKNLTVKMVKKKQKGKGGRGGKKTPQRVTTEAEPCDSFFNFFAPPDVDEDEDLNEEQAAEIDDMLEADFEVGCIFKDKLIRQAVLWYTGEAAELDEDYDEEFDEDDFSDDDAEDEEDEEDEDEDEQPKPKRGGGRGAGGRGGGAPAPNKPAAGHAKPPPAQPSQPECKQQ